MTFNVDEVKKDFPILDQTQGGKRLVFLDSASSSQRPQSVIDAMSAFSQTDYANVHRGVYQLAERATQRYEAARVAVANFVGAAHAHEIIFTKNATEAINLVAASWGRANLQRGDAVVVTTMEHHANIVPWQMLAAERGIELRWVEVDADYRLDLTNLDELLAGAKLLAVSHMSNVLGTVNPMGDLVTAAHKNGVLVLVDACQSVPHEPVNVQDLDVDFLVFSGHKMLGPNGIGVLWGRETLLDAMPPFMGGGGMIRQVTKELFIPDELPAKFEAGTPPITEAAGLHAAIEYLSAIGLEAIVEHERQLSAYFLKKINDTLGDDVTIFGPSTVEDRGAVFSLELRDVHAHDVSQLLDEYAICVRPGHHCAKPLMQHLQVPATARASLYLYNDIDDIDALADALAAALDFFAL